MTVYVFNFHFSMQINKVTTSVQLRSIILGWKTSLNHEWGPSLKNLNCAHVLKLIILIVSEILKSIWMSYLLDWSKNFTCDKKNKNWKKILICLIRSWSSCHHFGGDMWRMWSAQSYVSIALICHVLNFTVEQIINI